MKLWQLFRQYKHKNIAIVNTIEELNFQHVLLLVKMLLLKKKFKKKKKKSLT